jgi:aminopeptidase N
MARSVSGTYITQCEAEGFRRLTYFLDRPDVRSNFTVRIEADETACPVLLSNGNVRGAGRLPGGRHYAVYEVGAELHTN